MEGEERAPSRVARGCDDGPADAPSDDELVARCVRGQQDAFALLFDRYARQVYAIAYRISGDHAEAEDLTQDTFLRAFRALPALRRQQSFAGWLYRVATNISLDRLRRRTPHQVPLDAPLADVLASGARWGSPVDTVLASEDQRAVHATLGRLGRRQRLALTLHELHGLSYADTARAMGISADAAAILLFRARRRFREHYRRASDDAHDARRDTGAIQAS